MKLKKAVKKTKQYIYKGLVVIIPDGYKYIATDESGAVYLFALQPKTNQISDWDKSLMKVSDLKRYKHPKLMSDKEAIGTAINLAKTAVAMRKIFILDEKLEAIEQDRDDAIKLYYGSNK